MKNPCEECLVTSMCLNSCSEYKKYCVDSIKKLGFSCEPTGYDYHAFSFRQANRKIMFYKLYDNNLAYRVPVIVEFGARGSILSAISQEDPNESM